MTTLQKVIQYLAIAFAIFLAISILGGLLHVVAFFGGFFDDDAVTETLEGYAVSEDIRRLDVDIAAADLTIRQGTEVSVESNLKDLSVADENGTLVVKDTKKSINTYADAVLTIYIPANTTFENISICTGAGKMTAEQLSADTVDLELGAGEVSITSLSASEKADIEGGAGKVTIRGGALHDLDMDMGVGQLNLTSELTGDCAFDLGIGESNITVLGDREQYALDIEKGIGTVRVDGQTVSETNTKEKGSNRLEVNGGIGAINLQFDDNTHKN